MPAKKKVVVAEDEKPMARALQLKLEKKGYEVFLAYNGKQALEQVKKHKPHVMLLDLVMPELDGFGVLEELKKRKDKTPVIVSTNLSQQQDEQRVRELGAKDYFVKSNTSLVDVIKHIEKILGA